MNGPARVGVVGCGVISRQYADNARAFDEYEIVACADLDRERSDDPGARARARRADGRGARRGSHDRRRPQPDTTHRARRCHRVGARRRQARLHREAARHDGRRGERARGRGAAARSADRLRARHLPRWRVSGGASGDRRGGDRRTAVRERGDAARGPDDVASGSRHLLRRRRRPAPRHGPVLPDGARGAARAGSRRHRVCVHPDRGADDRDRPSNGRGLSGVDADAHHRGARARRRRDGGARQRASRRPSQYVCDLRIYGTDGDPRASRSELLRRRAADPPRPQRLGGRRATRPVDPQESRGLGLAEMVEAIDAERPHRASGELGRHIVAVARTILEAAATRLRRSGSTSPSTSRLRCPSRSTPRPRRDDRGARRTTEVPLLHEDGVAFRDRNRNGRLDPFEDPRGAGRRAGRRPARSHDARGEGRDDVPPGPRRRPRRASSSRSSARSRASRRPTSWAVAS